MDTSNMEYKEQHNARIPKDLRDEVKKYCKGNNINLDDFTTDAISSFLRDKAALSFPDRAAYQPDMYCRDDSDISRP